MPHPERVEWLLVRHTPCALNGYPLGRVWRATCDEGLQRLMVMWYTGIPARKTPSCGLEINRGIPLKKNPSNTRAVKPKPTGDELIAIRYKRLVNAGFIKATKTNADIPPLNRGHKSAYTKLIQQPGPRRVAEKPAQSVPFHVHDVRRMAAMLAVSGLSDWLTGSVLTVPTTPHERVYFGERAGTVTKQHADGTRLVIHLGVDYDALIATDSLPDTHYTVRQHVKKTDQKAKPRKLAPLIAILNPSNWQPASTRYDFDEYVAEGYKYKETMNQILGGKSTLVYIYMTTPGKKTGKTESMHADAMTAKFRFSTQFRKV